GPPPSGSPRAPDRRRRQLLGPRGPRQEDDRGRFQARLRRQAPAEGPRDRPADLAGEEAAAPRHRPRPPAPDRPRSGGPRRRRDPGPLYPLRKARARVTARYDLIVIGGGIFGLASAYQVLLARPGVKLLLVEKEKELAAHQTGHNSGVLHAGLYYAAGSKKARLCREGKAAVEKFADEHGIPYERCGKLVVALTEEELPRLAAIRDRALVNGVEGPEEVGPERIREIEPHAAGIRALWSPGSGIIDYVRVANAFAAEIRARGGEVRTGAAALAIVTRGGERVVRTPGGDFACRSLVSCAGLQSDRVAPMTGDEGAERIVPFRGGYYRLKPRARAL